MQNDTTAGSAGDQGEADRKIVTRLKFLANDQHLASPWRDAAFDALHLMGRLYDRLAASEARAQAAEARLRTLEALIEPMREALEKIARWRGEFPATGRFWDDLCERPMSYAACYGSNGERDFMRGLAARALAALPTTDKDAS